MSKSVVVVDYGLANVFSVCSALEKIGGSPILSGNPTVIAKAERVILPGVGAFSKTMDMLQNFGLDDAIAAFISTGRPFLGICVGMQVLMERSSEFGDHVGFGYIKGVVERISNKSVSGGKVKIPHVGWASLKMDPTSVPVNFYNGLSPESYFYFVHSFTCKPRSHSDLLATASYHWNEVAAIIGRDNILGVQFHPERSGPAGLSFLRQFMAGNLFISRF